MSYLGGSNSETQNMFRVDREEKHGVDLGNLGMPLISLNHHLKSARHFQFDVKSSYTQVSKGLAQSDA